MSINGMALNELAAALNDDSNAVATLTTSITNLTNNKQDNITEASPLPVGHVDGLISALNGKRKRIR